MKRVTYEETDREKVFKVARDLFLQGNGERGSQIDASRDSILELFTGVASQSYAQIVSLRPCDAMFMKLQSYKK